MPSPGPDDPATPRLTAEKEPPPLSNCGLPNEQIENPYQRATLERCPDWVPLAAEADETTDAGGTEKLGP